ncbi:MAG: hypothetical protein ACRD1K_20730 [Acidimicrobiales bacterium]
MSILDSSYGTPEEVASLVPRYTASGAFNTTTRPSLEQIERYLDRVSGIVNTLLAQEGFTVPIADPIGKSALDQLTIEAVVELCHLTNSAGRFFTDRTLRSQNPMRIIREELANWIDEHSAGLENLGAGRSTSLAGQIAYRDTDESGDPTFPIFQREGFGNRFDDWDK